jgi:multidrug resistance efflux pump
MAFEKKDLAEAERQLAEFRSQIERQEALISALEAGGHDAAAARARRLLKDLKETLRLGENHRNFIIAEITGGKG